MWTVYVRKKERGIPNTVQWQLRDTSIKEREERKTQHSLIRCKDVEK